jgi:hypothetical protein
MENLCWARGWLVIANLSYFTFNLLLTWSRIFLDVQEHVLSGGHGLMVQGYDPIIKALAKDIDIRLNHRYCFRFPRWLKCIYIFTWCVEKHAKKRKDKNKPRGGGWNWATTIRISLATYTLFPPRYTVLEEGLFNPRLLVWWQQILS